jgi:hypothetical protein
MAPFAPRLDIRQFYDHFDAPVTAFDCGEKCARHNPNGNPSAVISAMPFPWPTAGMGLICRAALSCGTSGARDECAGDPSDPAELRELTPRNMLLLACLGPAHCHARTAPPAAASSPFYYITPTTAFLGLGVRMGF